MLSRSAVLRVLLGLARRQRRQKNFFFSLAMFLSIAFVFNRCFTTCGYIVDAAVFALHDAFVLAFWFDISHECNTKKTELLTVTWKVYMAALLRTSLVSHCNLKL